MREVSSLEDRVSYNTRLFRRDSLVSKTKDRRSIQLKSNRSSSMESQDVSIKQIKMLI